MVERHERSDNNPISKWAHQLGLASSSLFGKFLQQGEEQHYALLDGRRGSFACSLIDRKEITISESRNWRWSADLAHHVFLDENEVVVTSGAENVSRKFARQSVEARLHDFYSFLEKGCSTILPDVVPFLVDEFLQIWAAFADPKERGIHALAAFLLALQSTEESDAQIIEDAQWRSEQASSLGLDETLVGDLESSVINRAATLTSRTPLGLKLVPGLVLRFVAGRLFQEAHSQLEAQPTLFGDHAVSTVASVSPTGAYFTPIPIARLLAESAFETWQTLPEPLTIADFACGSGVFLCEALRELERRCHKGTVRVIGRDISPEAITMAKVAVATTVSDLVHVKVVIDITESDVTQLTSWPKADVILMNPPFRSWENMSQSHKDWVRQAMGRTHQGRPDFSVAFVEHSLRALNPEGVVATLVPVGVLASEGLGKWRESLTTRSFPRLIAVLGEHGLFRHAFVNVGLLVLDTFHNSPKDRALNIAWASPETGAASEAIRALRRLVYATPQIKQTSGGLRSWTVTQAAPETWNERVSWLPGPGVLGSLLDSIKQAVPTRVEDLFAVHQGIRTGAKDVFVISSDFYNKLPRAEQCYFKPVVNTPSFVDGKIEPKNYLFVPDEQWTSEADVATAIPTFFASKLKPNQAQLMKRKEPPPARWWQLTRVRRWSFKGDPRLVSKRFGLCPAFAIDPTGDLAVVQANAWVPSKILFELKGEDAHGILTCYWWLLNSRVMVALLKEYCPNVAGGQLDLEKKYVRHVPLPNLASRLKEDPSLQDLAMNLQLQYESDLPSISERDRFAAAAYKTLVDDWPLS